MKKKREHNRKINDIRRRFKIDRNVPRQVNTPQFYITPPPIPENSLEDSSKTAPLTAINLFMDKIIEDDAENVAHARVNEPQISDFSNNFSYNIPKWSCLIDNPRCKRPNMLTPQPSVFTTNIQEHLPHQEDSQPREFTRTQRICFPYNSNTSNLLHKAKNLYNFALFVVRQLYFWVNGNFGDRSEDHLIKLIEVFKKGLEEVLPALSEQDITEIKQRFESLSDCIHYKNWNSIYTHLAAIFKYHSTYRALPYKVVSQQVLKKLKEEVKSFGKKMELFFQKKLKHQPSLPRFLPKNGEREIVYPRQMLDLKGIRQRMSAKRYVSPQYKTNTIPVPIPNKDLKNFPPIRMDFSMFNSIDDFFSKLKIIRIRPEGNYYVCDVVFSIDQNTLLENYNDLEPLETNRLLAIDFGSNNFVTTVNNIKENPELIKAKHIKKANYLIDSRFRKLQSEYDILQFIKYQYDRKSIPILDAIEKGIDITKQRRDNIYGLKGKSNPRLVELQTLIDEVKTKLTQIQYELDQNPFTNSPNKPFPPFSGGYTLNSEQFAFLEYERLNNEKVKLEKELKHSKNAKKYIISKYNEKIEIYYRIMDSLLVLPADKHFHYITKRMNNVKKQFLDIFAYRNRLITDRLHKISKYLINYCLIHRIGVIIVGYNAGWKQNGSLGKKNNRIFQKLPHYYLLEKLKYKAELFGIQIIEVNEFNTSRCSALDLEPLDREFGFIGQRGLRIDPKSKNPKSRPYYTHSLFKSRYYGIIHSDVNGGFNMGRKSEFGHLFESYIIANRDFNRNVFNPIKVNDLDHALSHQNKKLLIQV
ncbi:MAG: IS200/IS605 family accessory protein TnpB-related protein [Promethearchaeota archaeon]